MDYYADRAITKIEEDRLGRASFSQRLGKAICEYKGTDSLVIGLYGKWGTGKTSIVNLAIKTIETQAIEKETKPIILRFAPWNYADNDTLIRIFFAELQKLINKDGSKQFKKNVGKALKDYADVLDAVSLIPVVGSVIAPILKTAAKISGEMLSKSADLNKSKKRLSDVLREEKTKIIVVIDDIDRLTNDQIRDIFQLVKQVGDLPNIIYILIMDRSVVSRALSAVHNCDGNEYLGKIVQIPFEIPELKKETLQNIFMDRLNDILLDYSNKLVLDLVEFRSIFRNCIEPYLHSMRDINRTINVVQFRIGLFLREISLNDLVGITAIEVLNPELYKWIVSNKAALCEQVTDYNSSGKPCNERRAYYEEQFKRIGLAPKEACLSVATLFPKFGLATGTLFDSGLGKTRMDSTQIRYEKSFDLFFFAQLETIQVSEDLVSSIINSLDEQQLMETFNKVYKEGKLHYYLERIDSNCDRIPSERYRLIISALIDLAKNKEPTKNHSSRNDKDVVIICETVDMLLSHMTDDKVKYQLLFIKLNNCNGQTLKLFAYLLKELNSYHKRKMIESGEEVEPALSERYRSLLCTLFADRTKSIFFHKSIYCLKEYLTVIKAWEAYDKTSVKEYKDKLLRDRESSIKFLGSCMTKIKESDDFDEYEEEEDFFTTEEFKIGYDDCIFFFPKEDILKLSKRMDSEIFSRLTDLDRIRFAALVICLSKSKGSVSSEDATMLVEEWKTKYQQ